MRYLSVDHFGRSCTKIRKTREVIRKESLVCLIKLATRRIQKDLERVEGFREVFNQRG